MSKPEINKDSKNLRDLDNLKISKNINSKIISESSKYPKNQKIIEKNRIFIFGAKATGSSHIKRNIVCQDAFKYLKFGDDSAVIAVSDGLGSAVHSDTGASIAVNAAAETARRHFSVKYSDNSTSADITKNCQIIKECFESAVSEIKEYSAEREIPINELACTLIVVFIYKNSVNAGQIGDGGVVGRFKNGDVEIIMEPAESEYINEVTPITSENWSLNLRINENISGADSVAVFTDGCQRAILVKEDAKYIPFIPFFKPLFSYSHSTEDESKSCLDVESLLLSEKLNEVSDDDKTLVISAIKKNTTREF